MTGTEKITDRIQTQASLQAEEITNAAKRQVDDALRRAEAEANKAAQDIIERAKQNAQESVIRIMAVTDLTLRKELLIKKHEVLKEAFDRASELFAVLDDTQFSNIYRKLVLGAVQKGNESIAPAKGDAHRLDETFVAAINADLNKSGRAGELHLLPGRDDIQGGCVLISGEMEIDLSVKSILENVRETTEGEVAKLLFAFMEG